MLSDKLKQILFLSAPGAIIQSHDDLPIISERERRERTWREEDALIVRPSKLATDDPKRYLASLSNNQRKVLDYLIRMSVQYGEVYPTQSTIGKHVGLARQNVNVVLKELIELGLISSNYRHLKSCVYKLSPFFYIPEIVKKLASVFVALTLTLGVMTQLRFNKLYLNNINSLYTTPRMRAREISSNLGQNMDNNFFTYGNSRKTYKKNPKRGGINPYPHRDVTTTPEKPTTITTIDKFNLNPYNPVYEAPAQPEFNRSEALLMHEKDRINQSNNKKTVRDITTILTEIADWDGGKLYKANMWLGKDAVEKMSEAILKGLREELAIAYQQHEPPKQQNLYIVENYRDNYILEPSDIDGDANEDYQEMMFPPPTQLRIL